MGTVCFHSCALQEDTHSYRCTNYLWKYTPNRDRFATVVILFFFFFTVWSFTYNFKFCILTRILPLSSRSVFQMPDFQLPQPDPPAFLTDTFNLVNTKLGSWSSPQNLSSSRAPTTVNSTIPSVAQAQSLSCSLLLPLPSSTSSHQSNGCFLFFASTSAHLHWQCPKPSNPRLSLAFPWH